MVSAGSVVTRSLPPGSVAVGVPARIVRRREDYGDRDGDASDGETGRDASAESREAASVVAAETE